MSKTYLGVDIGGTAVKLGLVDENGRVLRRAERSVSFDGYKTPILDTVQRAIRDFLAEDAPEDSGSKDEVSQDGGLFSGLDLGSMAKIAGLLSAAGNTSDDEKLLMALKPLLREDNRGKVDTAMRLLKLIELLPLLKESGIFGKLGG